ncbi:lipopolysaccharide biosynthesis protein [Cesiribacter andamanensis]|uniref:Lipopolysaccharide biosynthesis protein wzxC n=1 Tax=Cesiribacter andamanensis AMV16 TaxID=1279009 RepID=M7NPR1_9BACT|nr:lipopolysaccharide biosynthesis protein [Cesiribacter andamanensis]EMR03700.1 Lipopolysaccharide biosynthesis protein wzxC [Cesiribacter andamanensis AMV16]
MSLRTEGRSSVFWASIDKFGAQFFQFAFSVVLARILTPEEFGLVGILMAVIAILRPFMEGGLDAALIQRKRVSVRDLSSVFWANLLFSLLLTGLLWLLAPWLSSWYGDARLTDPLRVLSLMLVGEALALIQYVCLYRQLAFKKLALVTGSSVLISGALGVYLALLGFSYWSLVGRQLAYSAVSTGLLWVLIRADIRLQLSPARVLHHLKFGYTLMLSGLLNKGVVQLYPLLIGKLYSPAQLAYYSRAHATKDIPIVSIGAIFSRVFFPIFSKMQDDAGRLQGALLEVGHILHFSVVWILLLLALAAEEIVLLLFTEKWIAVAPYLQLVVLVGLFLPGYSLNGYVLVARGQPQRMLQQELINKGLAVSLLAATVWLGIGAIILGHALVSLFSFVLSAWYVQQSLGLSLGRQLGLFLRYSLSGGACWGLLAYLLPPVEGLWAAFGAKLVLGSGLYLFIVTFIARAPALPLLWTHLAQFLTKQPAGSRP